MLIEQFHAKHALAGALHAHIWESTATSADDVTRLASLPGIDDAWIMVNRQTALLILHSLLLSDLAHNTPRLSSESATECSTEFLSHFSDTAAFYTNGTWDKKAATFLTLTQWTPLTQATFDSGIVALDHGKCGLLWIEDED